VCPSVVGGRGHPLNTTGPRLPFRPIGDGLERSCEETPTYPSARPRRPARPLSSARPVAAMRWLLAILLVLLLVIVDQFRFRGYYTSEVSRQMRNAITSITR